MLYIPYINTGDAMNLDDEERQEEQERCQFVAALFGYTLACIGLVYLVWKLAHVLGGM